MENQIQNSNKSPIEELKNVLIEVLWDNANDRKLNLRNLEEHELKEIGGTSA